VTTHLLVGNPTAQSGKNAARIELAIGELRSAGVACELMPTLPGGATIGAVRDALGGAAYACAIAMGGDGTFREVAAGILESGRAESVSLAMLPTGTANDQGRSFGVLAGDDQLSHNVAVIAAARETRLDAGRLEAVDSGKKTWFFDSAGWGLSARVLAARNEDREMVEAVPGLRAVYRDQLVYAGALLRTFLESYVTDDTFAVDAELDGKPVTIDGVTDLIVKGTRMYGGAWVFDRTARHDDGAFELIPFRGKLDWTSKAIVGLDGNPITEEMLNSIGVEHSKPIRASRFDLRFRPKAPAAQVDGEELAAAPHVRIEVVPRALRLIVPAESA
jgi:diacylglycerol kinase family enzyme